MRNFIRRFFPRPPADAQPAPEETIPRFDATPDLPCHFGYKISWFAVKTADPLAVLGTLGLGGAVLAGWATGVDAAYTRMESKDRWAFISPPVDGWVFAVSGAWPYPIEETRHDTGAKFDALFARLMKRFDDVQYFGSHRVSDFATWARALDGKRVRVFGYADGQVLTNFGKQTAEEAKLKLADVTGLSLFDATDKIFEAIAGDEDTTEGTSVFPDETVVTELAALWSVDPLELSEQDHPPGVGWAVRLPDHLKV